MDLLHFELQKRIVLDPFLCFFGQFCTQQLQFTPSFFAWISVTTFGSWHEVSYKEEEHKGRGDFAG